MSSSVTIFLSTIVNEPIPGNISDFNISVPTADALIKQIFDDSKHF